MDDRFEGDWLSLRQSADHRARLNEATDACLAWCGGRGGLSVVDLGCGQGSGMQFLAERLTSGSRWLLVDHDPAHLDAASAAAASIGVEAETRVVDLAAADFHSLLEGRDLVTCAALIDLVSEDWLDRMVEAVMARAGALLVATSIDGRVGWSPELAFDRDMHALVRAHERRDKGFGPSLGGEAASTLERKLQSQGVSVVTAAADWDLAETQAPLQQAYLAGIVQAALEQAPDRSDRIRAWANQRRAAIEGGRSRLIVGHADLFATVR
ncbi:MAG: class I SAM-dependent methyltransferase [Geminicoccaceae bacterium]